MTVRELIIELEKHKRSLDVVVVEPDSSWKEIRSVRVIKLGRTGFEIGLALSTAEGRAESSRVLRPQR